MMRTITCGAVALLLAACATNPYTGEQQASKKAWGAGIGATAGAVAGVLSGDDADERRKRALIGAGVGALAGTAVGAYMDAQEAQLRQELQHTGVSVSRQGEELVLNMPGHITFDVNRADLKADFYPVLKSVSRVLREYDKTLVDVSGHTDSTGSKSHNMSLAEQRAQSVGRYLASHGVADLRIVTEGFGPDHPVASNATAEGRQQNRRVELVLRPIS